MTSAEKLVLLVAVSDKEDSAWISTCDFFDDISFSGP